MLGSDRSRGYCLEMICADFLAGANLDNGDPETLLFSINRFFQASSRSTEAGFPQEPGRRSGMNLIRPQAARVRLDPEPTRIYASKFSVVMGGAVKRAARWRTWRCTTNNFAASLAQTLRRT